MDGVAAPQAKAEIRIPRSTKSIVFDVGDDSSSPPVGRIRYKLEGFDSDWQERRGFMFFGVAFFDETGGLFGKKTYVVDGQSAGWKGSVESSTFTHRRETIAVPARAVQMLVSISSAGPSSVEGIYLVKNIVVARGPEGREAPKILLDSTPFLRSGSEESQGMPKWIPDGTRPSMATRIDLDKTRLTDSAFCILDDDLSTHAEWHSSQAYAPKVIPGEQLTVEWNEMYNTGEGGKFHVRYNLPPAGHYSFKIQELDVLGHPLEANNSTALLVPAPYWKAPWFWAGVAIGAAALFLFGAKWWIRAKVRRHLQHARLVERERLRIARDLHDDLGARLTHISLMSSHAGSKAASIDPVATLQKVSTMTRELIVALSEIIWTVNPENDHLESLVGFLCKNINDLCAPSSIRCRVDALGLMDERPVRSEIRHNVSLAVKEAVNNVLKHSGADELQVKIRFDEPVLNISISDNGCGFSPERPAKGKGLINMKQRMAAINGKMTLESAGGTAIRFEVPIA